jgi:hypothetical protein
VFRRPSFGQTTGFVAANYAKRIADKNGGLYDRVMATEWGQKIVALPGGTKLLLELTAYLADTFTQYNLDQDSPIWIFIAQFMGDVPSELAKRMFNGKEHSELHAGDDKHGLKAIFDLDERDKLFAWYRLADEPVRRSFAKHCLKWSASDLTKFAGMTDEDKAALLDLCAPPRQPSTLKPRIIAGLETITARLNKVAANNR